MTQAIQDFIDRRGFKRTARWIFRTRVRWYVWRGQVESVRVERRD